MKRNRNAYKVLIEKSVEKVTSGRPRRRWNDDIKMNLKEIGFEDVDWIHLAQDTVQWRAFVNTIMRLLFP
jgi:hypothetical protein